MKCLSILLSSSAVRPTSPASAVHEIVPFFLRFLACGRSSLLNGIACSAIPYLNRGRYCTRQLHIYSAFSIGFSTALRPETYYSHKASSWHDVGSPRSSAPKISLGHKWKWTGTRLFAKFERPQNIRVSINSFHFFAKTPKHVSTFQ